MNIIETSPINTLRINKEVVALEAAFVTDAQELLSRVLPTIAQSFSNFANSFTGPAANVPISSSSKDFLNSLKSHSYLDISPIRAFVPEGMNVTYKEYNAVLEKAVAHSLVIADKTLSEYTTFLGRLITNDDEMRSLNSNDQQYRALANNREKLYAELGSCFKTNSIISETTFGKVTQRNSDWTDVITVSTKNALDISKVDRALLDKRVKEIIRLIDVVKDKAKREDFKKISPDVIKHLANGAFQMASEIEFYATTHYRVLSMSGSISNTIDNFKEIFKN